MESALIVSATDRGFQLLGAELDAMETVRAGSAAQALSEAKAQDFALALVNMPLPGESAVELVKILARETMTSVLLIAPTDGGEALERTAREAGVFIVWRPVSRPMLKQAVMNALAARTRFLLLRSESDRLQIKLDEARLVGRAKATLMQVLSMSEKQAHRYIEKQAMDLRTSRADVARSILKNYEL